ncbi:LuxR family transcriptional regulator [Paraburkholderia ribeironis]|uniref:LuxR family transcriptional regulator n=1 Tax=Paraburkholderia ribeironis TaxID=1247936 RepID=A0A1N7RM62_9BURK|nr:helix-turn-helix transcriptional regulator [Paraburkholderia ribeironis]SIT36138.1 LuxR family transcriptional regulator [Paraburkholderia ribeironis]
MNNGERTGAVDRTREWGDAIVLDGVTPGCWPLRHTEFDGPPSSGKSERREFGQLLLDLYSLAGQTGIGEFESAFFELLHQHLAFDAAWTGRATHAPDWPVLHCSFLHRLPRSFFTDWKSVRDLDPLARRTLGAFGKAAIISIVAPDIPNEFRDWGAKYGLAQLMCVCALDRRFGLTTFLSVYRHSLTQPFTNDEADFVENFIPHLAAAIDLNRSFHITRTQHASTSCAGICDRFGVLHYADAGFHHVATTEWPDWDGKRLPVVFTEHLRRRTNEPYVGVHISVRIAPIAGLFQLEAGARSPIDILSARELVVLRLWGEGLTYKQVAQKMAISPTTVRHHLRNAYRKLGMSNKAQILRVLNLGGPVSVASES